MGIKKTPGGITTISYIPQYSIMEHYDNDYKQDNLETNALLRELLSAVREGKVLKVDGRELGRTVQEQDKAHFNMTGRGLFIY